MIYKEGITLKEISHNQMETSLPNLETNLPNLGTNHLSLANIIQGIRELPGGKATGLSGIPNEALKIAIYPFSSLLEKLFKFIWKEGSIPLSCPKKG